MQAQQTVAPAKPAPAKPRIVVEAYSWRRQGWPYVRPAALVLALATLLGGALVTGTYLMLVQAKPVTAAAQARQLAARTRLDQGEIERVELRDFQARFEHLRARGFVGAEDRLAVVEAIQSIQKARSLGPISFSLAPQQAVVLDPSVLEAPLALHASQLHLQLPLVHEMDLVHLLADLKTRGFFTVRECIIGNGGQSSATGQGVSLDAACTLYWLSVAAAAAPDPDLAAP